MKTSIKKTIHVVTVCVVIVGSVMVTKNIIHSIKHLYGLESGNNNAVTCFFDLISK